jgi:hypothetical protein
MTQNYGKRGDDVMVLWTLARRNRGDDVMALWTLARRVRMWRTIAIGLFVAGTFQWVACLLH